MKDDRDSSPTGLHGSFGGASAFGSGDCGTIPQRIILRLLVITKDRLQHEHYVVNCMHGCYPCHAEFIKRSHPLLIFSQSDCLIWIVAINSHT